MAKLFDNSSGITFDQDYGYFDGADSDLVYLNQGVSSSEGFGIASVVLLAEAQQIASLEAWETPVLGHGLIVSGIASEEVFEFSPIRELHVQWYKVSAEKQVWESASKGASVWGSQSTSNTNWSK